MRLAKGLDFFEAADFWETSSSDHSSLQRSRSTDKSAHMDEADGAGAQSQPALGCIPCRDCIIAAVRPRPASGPQSQSPARGGAEQTVCQSNSAVRVIVCHTRLPILGRAPVDAAVLPHIQVPILESAAGVGRGAPGERSARRGPLVWRATHFASTHFSKHAAVSLCVRAVHTGLDVSTRGAHRLVRAGSQRAGGTHFPNSSTLYSISCGAQVRRRQGRRSSTRAAPQATRLPGHLKRFLLIFGTLRRSHGSRRSLSREPARQRPQHNE